MTSDDDLKALVLDAALAQALRTIDVVREHGLDYGEVTDTVDVAGVEWHIKTTYSRPLDGVRVSGHSISKTEAPLPAPLAAIFGVEAGSRVEFDWQVPAQWLRAAARPAGSEVRP